MADFDAEVLQQDQQQQEQNRLFQLGQKIQLLVNEIHHLCNVVARTFSTPPTQSRPNLNLPQPPPFSRVPSELPTFKLNLHQFLRGNNNTYTDSETQLLHAGSLLSESAGQWYQS